MNARTGDPAMKTKPKSSYRVDFHVDLVKTLLTLAGIDRRRDRTKRLIGLYHGKWPLDKGAKNGTA
jgi:hypothetical protein